MDIGTGLALIGAKDLIIKLLGPTTDYIGGGLKNNVEKCNENIRRIFNYSIKILGPKIEKKGRVSPRILKHILNEGAFVRMNYRHNILAAF